MLAKLNSFLDGPLIGFNWILICPFTLNGKEMKWDFDGTPIQKQWWVIWYYHYIF